MISKLLVILTSIVISSFIFIQINLSSSTAKINGHVFSIEVASSQKEQEIGLSKYVKIKSNFGMYFPFKNRDYYTFWMKGMKFPIDIIFISYGKIVTIYKDVPVQNGNFLPTYSPTSPIDRVLEISAGLSEKYNFKIGDNVKIRL